MDFILNNKQIKEFLNICFCEINKKSNNTYSFTVLKYTTSDVTISVLKNYSSATICHIIFTDDTVYSIYPSHVRSLMVPYIAYKYKIFGEEYLKTIEAAKRKQIANEKAQAYTQIHYDMEDYSLLHKEPKYYSRLNKELDDELADYLSYLDEVRNSDLKR